jgi:hypothetical protein
VGESSDGVVGRASWGEPHRRNETRDSITQGLLDKQPAQQGRRCLALVHPWEGTAGGRVCLRLPVLFFRPPCSLVPAAVHQRILQTPLVHNKQHNSSTRVHKSTTLDGRPVQAGSRVWWSAALCRQLHCSTAPEANESRPGGLLSDVKVVRGERRLHTLPAALDLCHFLPTRRRIYASEPSART